MNALYIRIPKTGSVSILEALGPNLKNKGGGSALDIIVAFRRRWWLKRHPRGLLRFVDSKGEYEKILKSSAKSKEDCFKFSFIRNPFDRAVSSWKFGSWNEGWNCSFKGFAEALTKEDLSFPTNERLSHACTQHSFLIDESGKKMADFIGRFENLQEDFNTVCDKIGIPRQKLSHCNKTDHRSYVKYYDDETRKIIAEVYNKDIEYFGYEFEQ